MATWPCSMPPRFQDGAQVERHAGGRQHLAAHRQHAVRLAHRLLEVAGHRGHGRDEQVAEGVVVEAGAGREAVLHELRHQRLGIGQGGDAVADVARRHDPQLLPQPAARSAVVGDRHDGGDVGRVALQAAQQGGQPGAAADRHDPRPAREVALGVEHLHHRVAARHERRDDAAHQTPHADAGDQDAERGDQDGADRADPARRR